MTLRKTFAIATLCALTSFAFANSVKEIKVKDIDAYIKSHSHDKPLIIHFSSKDRGCGPCLFDNGSMDEASYTLNKHFNIVAIYFDPWRSISKHKELSKKYEIRGLPSTAIVSKGEIKAAQSGTIKNKIKVYEKMRNTLLKPK